MNCIFLFVLSHEYISGYYRLSVYFLSKILSDILMLRTIPAVVFSCVAYFMIGELDPNPKKWKEEKMLMCEQIIQSNLKVGCSEVLKVAEVLSIPCSEDKGKLFIGFFVRFCVCSWHQTPI